MKRIISLLLAVMTVLALTACGGKTTTVGAQSLAKALAARAAKTAAALPEAWHKECPKTHAHSHALGPIPSRIVFVRAVVPYNHLLIQSVVEIRVQAALSG